MVCIGLWLPSKRYDGAMRERARVVACSAALTGFVVELADGLLISHYSSNRRRTKGQEFTMYNSVHPGIAGRGTYRKGDSRFGRACGCTVFWAWRSWAHARAKQAAIAYCCLQTFFRRMHKSFGIRKLIASIYGAVIATNDSEVAMMCWWC